MAMYIPGLAEHNRKNKVNLTIRIDRDVDSLIRALAAENSCNLGTVVEQLIKAYVKEAAIVDELEREKEMVEA